MVLSLSILASESVNAAVDADVVGDGIGGPIPMP
jgi:hypothetical protein